MNTVLGAAAIATTAAAACFVAGLAAFLLPVRLLLAAVQAVTEHRDTTVAAREASATAWQASPWATLERLDRLDRPGRP